MKKLQFYEKLCSLISAGFSFRGVLQGLADSDERHPEKYRAMIAVLEQGNDIAEVIKVAFSVSSTEETLLSAAQSTGKMTSALESLVEYGQKNAQFREDIIRSLMKPAFTFLIAFIVFLGVTLFIVPKMLASMPMKTTPFIITVLGSIGKVMPFFLVLGAAATFLAISLYFTAPYRFWQGVYSIPVIGAIKKYDTIYTLFLTVALLTGGGVNPLSALRLVANNADAYFSEIITYIIAQTEMGVPLRTSFADTMIFPFYCIEMVDTAEKANEYSRYFREASSLAEKDFHERKNTLLPLIEAAVMVAVAAIIITTIMSVLIPIQQLGDGAFNGKGI